ncbi:MAG: adenine phosphoribosyltransferase [Bacilli bacterium]|nr:adenine phosphoribosyltransferase [Bacilli bacterium]
MANNINLEDYIANVPDFPIPGIQFKDITPTLEDPEAFEAVINEMASKFDPNSFDKIIAADARGFLFGAPLAYKLHKGLVVSRKPGKLPRPGHSYSYSLEYGKNTMVIPEGSIKPGERVLLIDDLLATGGSAIAMVKLVEQSGGKAIGSIFYVELVDLKGREPLEKAGVPVESILTFHGE